MIARGEPSSRGPERTAALQGGAGGSPGAGAGGLAGARSLAAGTSSRTRAVYVISVAAELAGVHPQTLRIYERRGLLDPARTGGGSRRYSEADIAQLRRIQDLTNAGLNLEGVRRVIELEAEVDRLRQELEETKKEAREAVARTHRQYRRDLVPVRHSPERWLPGRPG